MNGYSTRDLCSAAGWDRQRVQVWSMNGLLECERGSRDWRRFTLAQMVYALALGELYNKGLSVHALHRIAPAMRTVIAQVDWRPFLKTPPNEEALLVISPAGSVHLTADTRDVMALGRTGVAGIYVVSLTKTLLRIGVIPQHHQEAAA